MFNLFKKPPKEFEEKTYEINPEMAYELIKSINIPFMYGWISFLNKTQENTNGHAEFNYRNGTIYNVDFTFNITKEDIILEDNASCLNDILSKNSPTELKFLSDIDIIFDAPVYKGNPFEKFFNYHLSFFEENDFIIDGFFFKWDAGRYELEKQKNVVEKFMNQEYKNRLIKNYKKLVSGEKLVKALENNFEALPGLFANLENKFKV